jgi:glycerophosphoryl diester phosphodiesterase
MEGYSGRDMTALKAKTQIRRRASAALLLVGALLAATSTSAFDLQGHRGARGLAPENTLEGFRKALEIGVTTLETDLAITKDGIVVLSHDRVLNPDITRGPDGAWLTIHGPAINQLTLAELSRYDVGGIKPGTKYAQQFADQWHVGGARIPTLVELFALTKALGKTVRFNIEIKVSPDHPSEAPDPETFVRLVAKVVRDAGLGSRVTIQSFDWRTLIAVRKMAPEIETVCLTAQATLRDRVASEQRRPSPWLGGLDPAEHGGSTPRLVKAAGCATWSPRHAELTVEQVESAHAAGLKVVPWTINTPADMARAIDMGVDGLITDYPDRARKVMIERGMTPP